MSHAPVARRRTPALAATALASLGALLLGACSDDTPAPAPKPARVAPLVDDLCRQIPDDMREKLELDDVSHRTSPSPGIDTDDVRRATCTTKGTYFDRPLTLSFSVTSVGGPSEDAARERQLDDLEAACGSLEDRASASGAAFREGPDEDGLDDESCTAETPTGSFTSIRSSASGGLETIDISYVAPPDLGAVPGLVRTYAARLSFALVLDDDLERPS